MSEKNMMHIYNANFILDQLLKFDRSDMPVPQNKEEREILQAIAGLLAKMNRPLTVIPSDRKLFKELNDFLKENFRVYAHFVDNNPVMAGFITKETARTLPDENYVIIPLQLPKRLMREDLRNALEKRNKI